MKDAGGDVTPPPPTPLHKPSAVKEELVVKTPKVVARKKKICIPDDHYINHFPKHPDCIICNQCKIQNSQARRIKEDARTNEPKPENFADQVTADHMILGPEEKNKHGDTVALVIQDRASRWLQSYGQSAKAYDHNMDSFQKYFGPHVKPKSVYSDNAPELNKTFKELGWSHDTCTPHRPQTNGIAERAVRRVKEGTRCALVQSGLSSEWWREAMECFCFNFNATDVQQFGETPYQNIFVFHLQGLSTLLAPRCSISLRPQQTLKDEKLLVPKYIFEPLDKTSRITF